MLNEKLSFQKPINPTLDGETLICELKDLQPTELERLLINIGVVKVIYETTDSQQHLVTTPVLFDTVESAVAPHPLVSN